MNHRGGHFKYNSLEGYVAKEEMPEYLSNLFRAKRPLQPIPAMPKAKYTGLNALQDDHRSLEQIFQEAKARHYANGDDEFGRKARETKEEKNLRIKKEQVVTQIKNLKANREQWRPHYDKNALGTDAYRTIFVGRLSYDTTEERLKREFDGVFGDVMHVHIVKDSKTGKSRGYGFVEFSDDREADEAVKRGDGRRVDGRRIIVDRELGRTKATWYPRRLGGGKGESRRDRRDEELIRELKKQVLKEQGAEKPLTGAGEKNPEKKAEAEKLASTTGQEETKDVKATEAQDPAVKQTQEIPAKDVKEEPAKETNVSSPQVASLERGADSSDIDRRRHDRERGEKRRDTYRSSRRRSRSKSRSYSPPDRYSSNRDRDRDRGYHHREGREHRRDRDREGGHRDYDRRNYGGTSKASNERRSYRNDRDRSYDERGPSGRSYDQVAKPSFYVSGSTTKRDSSVKDPADSRKEPAVKVVEEREDGEL